MSRNTKLALGIATFLQIPVIIAIIVIFFSAFFALTKDGPQAIEENIGWLQLIALAINVFAAIYFGALDLFYIVHAARNPYIEWIRVQWVLGIIFLAPIVTPFYWYHNVWRDDIVPE
ncbi:MAG TPA: hypothetical protein PKA82_08265 [Pyrinomonadaceae bacterium]|nr:hypothetical protein [Pyrinomonadaceae bacterium]